MAVFGVGEYEPGQWLCRDADGKHTKEYVLWKHMLERCYSENYKEKYPTYNGCSVDPEFWNFQRFMQWAVKQDGFGLPLACLDKDLLVKKNKVYSPVTCAFVPEAINGVLNKHKKRRGDLPIGVSRNAGKFMATVCIDGRNKNLGRFSTPEEAFTVYKSAKEAYIKTLADRFKEDISPEAFQALMEYKVEYND